MDRKAKTSASEFVRLTEPHHRHLYGIALSLCRDADRAADLAQETLIRAFEAFDQFRPGSPVQPWLRRILRNLFLDSFKTGRSRHEVTETELTKSGGLPPQPETEEGDDPLARLERAELAGWLREEMASLEPEHQQVLTLCVMHDVGFKEAAELLGVPVGTVASRLARARAKLRERMLKKASSQGAGAGQGGSCVSTDGEQPPGRRDQGPKEASATSDEEEDPDRAEEARS